MVRVGCPGAGGAESQAMDHEFDIPRERINRLTCHDGSEATAGGCTPVAQNWQECGAG